MNHKLNLGFNQLPVFLQHPPFAEWLNQVPLHFSKKQRPSSFKLPGTIRKKKAASEQDMLGEPTPQVVFFL